MARAARTKRAISTTNCPSVSLLLSIKSITSPMILGGMRFKKLTKIKDPIPIKYRFFSKLKNQDNFLNRFILFPLFGELPATIHQSKQVLISNCSIERDTQPIFFIHMKSWINPLLLNELSYLIRLDIQNFYFP